MNERIVAIVQARMGSTRFESKVLADIAGRPMLWHIVSRLKRCPSLKDIVVATTDGACDDAIAGFCVRHDIGCFRGSETDVLERYYQAAKKYEADVVVRITGDCPLVDPQLLDSVISMFKGNDVDYASNVQPPTFPDGLDVEVFSFSALKTARLETSKTHDREHVTPYLRESGRFRTMNFANDFDQSGERWTVDEPVDLRVIKSVYEHFWPRNDFGWKDVMQLKRDKPELFLDNKELKRNEGAEICTGQKLWRRAKKVIPGGNMLLSKRAEMFLPNIWPTYFSKARGCKVWDLDGKEFTDMSFMGIGTNTLGYGHPEIDEAVRMVIGSGNMSTLNCPEEVYLAEKLVELHPWSSMVRFARTGGEANAVAIRIARAATGKEKVAICGYHGWHDWYLAANLGDDKNLAGYLLPGLEPKGVPENLRGTVLPFNYNDIQALESLVRENDIGAIKMEVSRNQGPVDGFLHKVRDLATKNGIVLIFDECTSGFRQTMGGLHKTFGVEPDMAIFGKALGNGYAITAVIGRREVMEAAQTTFISSTFWTERIGPTAGLKTLEVMERTRSYEQITMTGLNIGDGWQKLAARYGLDIQVSGLPALVGFCFKCPNAIAYKTLITQEMLEKGYLAGTSVYVCTEHTDAVVNDYFEVLDPIFALVKECEEGRDIMTLLKGPTCHTGFKRLN